MKKKVCYFILLTLVLSCRAQNQKTKKVSYNSTAIELNNIAMDIIRNNDNNIDSFNKVMQLLDQSIQKDSSYYLAYNNKAQLLCEREKYNEAIITLDKILKINPALVEVKTFKAFMLEKSGNNDKALDIYKNVLEDYNRNLSTDSDNISLLLNRAFIYFFIDGQDRAIKEYNKVSKLFPNNRTVENMRETFINFDRQSFINTICSK